MRKLLLILGLLTVAVPARADDYVFMTVLMRAAPGRLPALIEVLKKDMARHAEYGLEKPFLMRHSQGDHWDLLLLVPIESLQAFYSPANAAKRAKSKCFGRPYGDDFFDHLAHYEELFVSGPTPREVRARFEAFDFYHVEMFVAVPGEQSRLLEQRQMENVYYRESAREGNLIFKRVAGSAWDVYTIGFYDDHEHFAGSGADIPKQVKDRAARKAGFKNLDHISFYLRELIARHHDTLANAVR